MTPIKEGMHCDLCNKTVIDFSLYSDKELVEFFKHAQGEVCGSIPKFKLNTPITYTELPERNIWQRFFLGTAIATWLSSNISAQPKAGHSVTPNPISNTDSKKPGNDSKVSVRSNIDPSHYIEGTVITTKGRKMQNVRVEFYDDSISTYTDTNGYFKFMIPDDRIGKKVQLCALGIIKRKLKLTDFPITLKKPIKLKPHYPKAFGRVSYT
jgi:hypothetical protein